MTDLRCITWPEFAKARDKNPRYYTADRWEYYQAARDWLGRYPGKVLELGPGPCPLTCSRNMLMDWADCSGKRPMLLANLNYGIPLPDDMFEVAVALQVVEHLDNPAAAIAEMLRVAPAAVISVPYCWPKTEDPGHAGIDDKLLAEWTWGCKIARREMLGRSPYRRVMLALERM